MSTLKNFAQKLNDLSICIDHYQHYEMSGHIYFGSNTAAIDSRDIVSLCVLFEQFLDDVAMPCSSVKLRHFGKGRDERKRERELITLVHNAAIHKCGEKATFLVQIEYRQNATWQGSVIWVEENEKKPFRSALELIMLMESAMSENSFANENVLGEKQA